MLNSFDEFSLSPVLRGYAYSPKAPLPPATVSLCLQCTFKHVSAAAVAYQEVQNGYLQSWHLGLVVGNLAHAEAHLGMSKIDHAALVERIRAWRVGFANEFTASTADFTPTLRARNDEDIAVLEEILERVHQLILAEMKGVADGEETGGTGGPAGEGGEEAGEEIVQG